MTVGLLVFYIVLFIAGSIIGWWLSNKEKDNNENNSR